MCLWDLHVCKEFQEKLFCHAVHVCCPLQPSNKLTLTFIHLFGQGWSCRRTQTKVTDFSWIWEKRGVSDSSWMKGVLAMKLGISVLSSNMWRALPVYFCLSHRGGFLFFHLYTLHACFSLARAPLIPLPASLVFSAFFQCESHMNAGVPHPSFLFFFSSLARWVQLPVSRPLCLNSINFSQNLVCIWAAECTRVCARGHFV